MKQELIEKFMPYVAYVWHRKRRGEYEIDKYENSEQCAKIAEQHCLERIIEALQLTREKFEDLTTLNNEDQSEEIDMWFYAEIQSYQSQLKELKDV